ncbi:hypothetical protein V8C40DRAFT_52811 [Trichoderma camerunense]
MALMSWSIPCSPGRATRLVLAGPHHAAGGGQATAENTHIDGRSHCFPLALAICTSFIGFAATTDTTARLCCVCDLENRDSRCAYVLQRCPNTAAVSPIGFHDMSRWYNRSGSVTFIALLLRERGRLSQHAKRLDPYGASNSTPLMSRTKPLESSRG